MYASQDVSIGIDEKNPSASRVVAYRDVSVPLNAFEGVRVPVALWYPAPTVTSTEASSNVPTPAAYGHAISVSRIGKLLAGWDLPAFLRKNYGLSPTLGGDVVVKGDDVPLSPERSPVVLLAHGYLGSRFDLSHIAECLAQQGYVCVSPEYPESLAASYPRVEGLTRTEITQQLLFSSDGVEQDGGFLRTRLGVESSSNAVVGHSLGCGTATNTGDKSWVRVFIAGGPKERDDTLGGDMLFVSSVNDGAVSMVRLSDVVPKDLVPCDAGSWNDEAGEIPRRASFVFTDESNAPNHISFLAEGPNDAMINLLSPLLPVAQALGIPVLDFDKYSVSRDSKSTASVVIPLVTSYLQQRLK